MFSKRVDFDFLKDNIPDWMHNLARVFLMIMDIVLGGLGGSKRAKAWQGMDRRHRAECELFDIFPSVWLDQKVKLADDVRAALLQPSNEDIDTALRASLERFVRAVGVNPNDMLIGELRAKVIEIRNQLRQPGDFFYFPGKPSPLPWRLTPEAFEVVDERIHNMVFPHGVDRLVKEGLFGRRVWACMLMITNYTFTLCYFRLNFPAFNKSNIKDRP